MKKVGLLLAAALFAAQPSAAKKALKIVEPIAADVVGHAHVVGVDVTVGEAAAKTVAALEAKAAAKRTAAGLAPADPAAAATDPYATLPLAQMLPLEIRDVTTKWGLTDGRAVKLAVAIDTLKTADAGMAFLAGSADQLAGLVSVKDAATGAPLGEFYIDVVNFRAGLLMMAMRGSGVREKLAVGFAERVSEALSGRKHPAKAS